MNNIKVGSLVKMNNTYEVDEDNVDRLFKVISKPFDVCGTQCVLLENYSGAYALDGITLVSNLNFDGGYNLVVMALSLRH